VPATSTKPPVVSHAPDEPVTWTRQILKRRLEPYGFLTPTVLLLVVLMFLPIFLVIQYSFFDNVIFNDNPIAVGLSNYTAVLTDPVFATAVKNTAFFVGVSVAAHLVLGLSFAMLLNSSVLPASIRAIFRSIYIMPWLFTVAIIAVLWRLLLSPNGIVNFYLMELGLASDRIEWLSSLSLSLYAITFINIWAGYPFFMVSLLAGLQGIPNVLNEAAVVDGANGWQRFWHITIPQLKPIIISMALLDAIWTSQQFALIWLTTGGGPINVTEVLSTFTYKLAFTRYEFAMASASAVLVLLMSMVLAVLYVRHQKVQD
jgi:multiple sugar transport system permease protein